MSTSLSRVLSPIIVPIPTSLLRRRLVSYSSPNRKRLVDIRRLRCQSSKDIGLHETTPTTGWSTSNFGKALVVDRVVGILGGGQLGRMAALAAANLGVKVKCLDPTPNAPASVAAEQVIGDFKDPEAVLEFAKGCDVLTVEIEHVDIEALRKVTEKYAIPVQPSPDALEIIQDKYIQKVHFKSHGLPAGIALEVNDFESLEQICEQGLPVMLKSRRLAYDGRGNYVIHSMGDIQSGVEALGGYRNQLYAEQWVNFKKELAVMVARSVDGTVLSYPVVETIHKNSICFITEAPANVGHQILIEAQRIAEEAVGCLKGAGIFGVEMFLLDDDEILINEVAPRPHNSGHYTIDACLTSQFEQHIRAILGWPLGDPSLIAGSAIMLNILGEDSGRHGLIQAQSMIQNSLGISGAKAHWYEKADVKKNRKVGHINIIASSRIKARNKLKSLSVEANNLLTLTADEGSEDASEAQVSVIMGSDSDLKTMKAAAEVLEDFGISTEVTIVSAHRTPERMMDFARTAHRRGIKVIIAGAGGAAHLPGMVATLTPLPVIGVPCVPDGSHMDGMDALLSIVQMPRGVPVATVAVGNAANAGLLAVRILGAADPSLQERMLDYQEQMKDIVMKKVDRLNAQGWRE